MDKIIADDLISPGKTLLIRKIRPVIDHHHVKTASCRQLDLHMSHMSAAEDNESLLREDGGSTEQGMPELGRGGMASGPAGLL